MLKSIRIERPIQAGSLCYITLRTVGPRSEVALQARPRADSDRAAGQSSIGFQPVFCSR